MENTDQILDAPEVQKLQLEYAGFWIRTGAYALDMLILFGVSFVLARVMPSIYPWNTILDSVIGITYFGYMESSENQGTLGKMAVGIKVGNASGDQISFMNAIGRYFAKIVSALLLCIGFMMVGWDEKKQGIHDKLAETFVFYK
jgi:uncharacterized RDD family membrane protein YckC